MDRTVATLAGQVSFASVKVYWAPLCWARGPALFWSPQPSRENEVIDYLAVMGGGDRGVPGSYESPWGAPELYWGGQNGSLEELKGAWAAFSKPCWDSWVVQTGITSNSVYRALEVRKPGLGWTALAAGVWWWSWEIVFILPLTCAFPIFCYTTQHLC